MGMRGAFSNGEVTDALSWPLKVWTTRSEVWRIRHEPVVTKFNALSWYLLWQYEKRQEEPVTWVGVPTRVQTRQCALFIRSAAARMRGTSTVFSRTSSRTGVYVMKSRKNFAFESTLITYFFPTNTNKHSYVPEIIQLCPSSLGIITIKIKLAYTHKEVQYKCLTYWKLHFITNITILIFL